MAFIEVTVVRGPKMLVNARHVIRVYPEPNAGTGIRARVVTASGAEPAAWGVSESYSEIRAKLAEVGVKIA